LLREVEGSENKLCPLFDVHHRDARGGIPEPAIGIFDGPVEEDRHCLVFRAHVVFLEGEAVKEKDVLVAVRVGGQRIGEPFELMEADVGGAAGESDVEDEGLLRGEAAFPLDEEVNDCSLERAGISTYLFERFSPCQFHLGECAGDFRDDAQPPPLERVDDRRLSRGGRTVDHDPLCVHGHRALG